MTTQTPPRVPTVCADCGTVFLAFYPGYCAQALCSACVEDGADG